MPRLIICLKPYSGGSAITEPGAYLYSVCFWAISVFPCSGALLGINLSPPHPCMLSTSTAHSRPMVICGGCSFRAWWYCPPKAAVAAALAAKQGKQPAAQPTQPTAVLLKPQLVWRHRRDVGLSRAAGGQQGIAWQSAEQTAKQPW